MLADAPSPEEWPKHGGGSACRDLDGAVRCPICGDPFETPLSLRCGHAFCSGCVRSSIEYQERSGPASCPQCRGRCDTADLRPAPQLRAIAAAFLAARPLLLDSVRAAIGATQEAVAAVPSTRPQAGGRSRQRRQQPAQQDPSSGRRRPHKQASAPPNGTFISVDLSSGSEGDAQPQQAARRRQQPKRGCSALTAPADEADASQSTGSAKRHQLSSPSDEQQRTPSPAEPQPGQRLLRSTSRAAASAPSAAPVASADVAAKPDRQPGGNVPAVADSVAGPAVDSASDSHPEYLGEQGPGSTDDEAAAEAAAVPAPEQPPAREKLPSGHVRCPNCAKMLPQAFINSHLDSCLTGGKGGGGGIWGNAGGKNNTTPAAAQLNGVRSSSGGGGGHAHRTANGLGSGSLAGRASGSGGVGKQLKVPPKLCVALLSDKAMRDTCKGFGLPATGRKEVLAERYSRFRLEVQTANDTGEAASYADCVRRVRQRESRTAKAAFGAPLSRTPAASSPAGVGESSFEELIRVTQQRHAAQRAAAAAAATAAAAAAAAAPPAAQPDASASTPAPDAARTLADAAEAAPEAPLPAFGAARASQPTAARPADDVAHPAAGGQGDLPAAQEQPAADVDTWGNQGSADAAAAAPAQDAPLVHPAAQPLLDEQSCSASRSLDAAATAAPQHMRSDQRHLEAADCERQHSDAGAAQQPAEGFQQPSGIADTGLLQHELHQQPLSQQEAAQDMDAAASGGSLDAALPAGMTCTQQPAQPGPVLSCGQQLQLQQPFTFEGVFSDDSRSCPLSPSV